MINEINMEGVYLDQAMKRSRYGDRMVSSAFTPHGIRQIDSEYGIRIRNINNKVKSIYNCRRENGKRYHKGVITEAYLEYWDVQDETWLNHYNSDRIRVVWENGDDCILTYTEPYKLKFNIKTRTESVRSLRSAITNNPHLHDVIKDNLLLNLNNYINQRKDFPLT